MPTIIQYRPGSSRDVVDRHLRSSDLPRATTNAQADRTTQDSINARKRALMRVSGFGDDATSSAVTTDPSSGSPAVDASAASGGAQAAQNMFAAGAGLLPAIGTGVVTILAATLAVRLFDSIFGSRR